MPNQTDILNLLRIIRHHDSTIPKTRVGREGDGGYVINNDFENLDGVISFGIAGECSFDDFFAERGLKVYQYDPSVDGPPHDHPNFIFRKLAWGAHNSAETRSLQGVLDENGLSDCKELVLKFDVEGAEWTALFGTDTDILSKFRIITAEFHGFCQLTEQIIFDYMYRVFSLLNNTHLVTHIHPNNNNPVSLVFGVPLPNLLEISFLRRDRAIFNPSRAPIPSELDYPNALGPDIILTAFTDETR